MKSCVYRGEIYHKRFTPAEHAFQYQLDYLYLDLDEIDEVFALSRFWSKERSNLVSFRRQDYLPSDRPSLRDEVLHRIETLGGQPFAGKIYLLSTLRSLGYSMNPIALYYCYEQDQLKYVLAEVHNTPWDERHVYLLEGPEFTEPTQKSFHVSPFMPMNTTYEWKISDPDEHLVVAIKVGRNSEPLFTASMTLNQLTVDQHTVTSLVWQQARQAFRTIAAIYMQAAKLWIKKVPVYRHPNKKKLQESGQ